MENCPDKQELRNYATGSLGGIEKLRMNKHISACHECKRFLLRQPSMVTGAAIAVGGISTRRRPCPSEKELFDYVDATLSVKLSATLADHIEACDRCRTIVDDLRDLQSAQLAPGEARIAQGNAAQSFEPDYAYKTTSTASVAYRRPSMLVEYALILALILIVLTAIVGGLGRSANDQFDNSASAMPAP